MSGRDYDKEFEQGVWQRFNPGRDGGVDFRVLDEVFLRDGFSSNLYHGNLLSVLHCFSKPSPNIKFDSQYDEGDERRTKGLEEKIAEAIETVFKFLQEIPTSSDFHLSKQNFHIGNDTPDSVKALFRSFAAEGLRVRFEEATAAAAPAAESSLDNADATAGLLGGSAGTSSLEDGTDHPA